MRHRYKRKQFNKSKGEMKAFILNMQKAIIERERIVTTINKAKFIQPHVEKLITKAKKGDLSTHRYLLSKLRSKTLTKKLIYNIAPKYTARDGGYTRIQRTNSRKGDNAEQALLSFVENKKNDSKLVETEKKHIKDHKK